jgi:hypothetical protein
VALFASTASFLCVAGSMDMIRFCHDSAVASDAFQIGDYSIGDTHDVSWCSTEVVVPGARCGPHFVILQQVRVHEHTQLSAVTKGRHAIFGLGNPLSRNT